MVGARLAETVHVRLHVQTDVERRHGVGTGVVGLCQEREKGAPSSSMFARRSRTPFWADIGHHHGLRSGDATSRITNLDAAKGGAERMPRARMRKTDGSGLAPDRPDPVRTLGGDGDRGQGGRCQGGGKKSRPNRFSR
jgi:hypothetical protein